MNKYPVTKRPKIEYIKHGSVKIAKASTNDVIKLEKYIDYLEHKLNERLQTKKNSNNDEKRH